MVCREQLSVVWPPQLIRHLLLQFSLVMLPAALPLLWQKIGLIFVAILLTMGNTHRHTQSN